MNDYVKQKVVNIADHEIKQIIYYYINECSHLETVENFKENLENLISHSDMFKKKLEEYID